ncbi:MAG TPA: hypothetical protein VEZ52_13555, partial [Desulfovibrio sp.]|uniref:hypothetical protein n=1 Tax=Desulfovibrio sp. TaxID=885 RepID=UPI002D67E491
MQVFTFMRVLGGVSRHARAAISRLYPGLPHRIAAVDRHVTQARDTNKPCGGMAMAKHATPLLDQLESGPWPSFVSDIKQEAASRAQNP